MRTFHISTLGCKVNQYESGQIATLLRSRGLTPTDRPQQADLRIINTCSVTLHAAATSRQTVRRMVRLPVLDGPPEAHAPAARHTIIIGCWATSDRAQASRISGITAVIDHHQDVAAELDRLLSLWQSGRPDARRTTAQLERNDGWMIQASAHAADSVGATHSKPTAPCDVNGKTGGPAGKPPGDPGADAGMASRTGTRALPPLDSRQPRHQRAFLKIQDGCDAHCTYCIIPRLRPELWSKPLETVVEESRRLVDAGHAELVLTGIFLGAYGQPTALHRRQDPSGRKPLARLVEAICTRVPGLRRLRLSSLEPLDLDHTLLEVLQAHPQCVPHLHLPLQSGSDAILRLMNRQYTRDDYLRMIDRVHRAMDRPAITTDIIVGFPGETDAAFEETAQLARSAGFIHIHAFPFSPRPGTAAARWKNRFIDAAIVSQRSDRLRRIAAAHSLAFRRLFLGQPVELLVENPTSEARSTGLQHGRCERYFQVCFAAPTPLTGQRLSVIIENVTAGRTLGRLA
jgi:threonylcarbamoyladenosine tRNA methylthiotransferase MtaB